jgi:hypothetical protein
MHVSWHLPGVADIQRRPNAFGLEAGLAPALQATVKTPCFDNAIFVALASLARARTY